MLQSLLISAAINTSDACSPAETMAEAFLSHRWVNQCSFGFPNDSQGEWFQRWFSFSFTLNTDDTEVSGEITELCNAAEHWDITCYYIFVPNEPLMPETTYTLIDTSSEFGVWNPAHSPQEPKIPIVSTQTPEVELTEHNYNEADDFCGIMRTPFLYRFCFQPGVVRRPKYTPIPPSSRCEGNNCHERMSPSTQTLSPCISRHEYKRCLLHRFSPCSEWHTDWREHYSLC